VSPHFSVEPIELLLPGREFRMNNRHFGQIDPKLWNRQIYPHSTLDSGPQRFSAKLEYLSAQQPCSCGTRGWNQFPRLGPIDIERRHSDKKNNNEIPNHNWHENRWPQIGDMKKASNQASCRCDQKEKEDPMQRPRDRTRRRIQKEKSTRSAARQKRVRGPAFLGGQ
jgi:hypothetical protein